MPDLPPMPTLSQPQFDLLVEVFTAEATRQGIVDGGGQPDPAAAYVQWAVGNLVEKARAHRYAEVEVYAAELRAQVDADLGTLVSGG